MNDNKFKMLRKPIKPSNPRRLKTESITYESLSSVVDRFNDLGIPLDQVEIGLDNYGYDNGWSAVAEYNVCRYTAEEFDKKNKQYLKEMRKYNKWKKDNAAEIKKYIEAEVENKAKVAKLKKELEELCK